ncbi:MAG: tRNA preQ1(34) S-adenosylmethionine ribosyltransferase-isomerase QueA [Opitutaceae bacterium]|jgi:S-adenosylmethionine:tRNA ribosyltransferase-isomerase|nr:tRNA preQ1(34) S-adenosylmethionine ribosyltransferase-isomerase QueA [Opitutaceae bacterium]
MRTDLFDYELPPRLVAQTPADRRDRSRLLVVNRATREIAHRAFADLPEFLRPGDQLFLNNAAVLPARLRARRATGGAVECLLLRPAGQAAAASGETWLCLLRPGKKLPPGAAFSAPGFSARVLAKEDGGAALVRFDTDGGAPLADIANRDGEIPLPPYIARQAADARRALDRERYQTVYADRARQVAVAAPTAGLHFTPELLARLAAGGVERRDLTLHVGPGTFKPVSTDEIEDHPIHREICELPDATQRALFSGKRRVAVGTTSVRAIEDFLAAHDAPLGRPAVAETALFIHPPRAFRGVDVLLTNFHQPRSTLLCLVAAFLTPGGTGGVAWLREIYAEAIAREYRFFSYGDAMLIL